MKVIKNGYLFQDSWAKSSCWSMRLGKSRSWSELEAEWPWYGSFSACWLGNDIANDPADNDSWATSLPWSVWM